MSNRRTNGSRAHAAGQALVLCLVVAFAGAVGLYFLFGTGQITAARQRLNNAADAAAFSAAAWRARVMNYHAYANRAIVAEEVAIAQAVTLASWAKYAFHFTETAAELSRPYPPVAAFLEAAAEIASYVSDLTEETASEEIIARSAYKTALATSQEILQRAVDTFGLGAVANEVARANDRRFFAFALPDAGDFAGMSRRYERDDRMRLKDVVAASLDPFVAGPRGFDMPLPLPSQCFGNPLAPPSTWLFMLRKRGGTTMAPELERWEAGDTMSLHDFQARRGFLGAFRGCRDVEAMPLGWGAAEASLEAANRFVANPGDVDANRAAADLAESVMYGNGYPGFEAYPGIEAVRELDYAALANPRFPVSRVAVLARVDGDDVRTANVLNVGVGRLRLSESLAGHRLWALAAAEVYFRRPSGAPERLEYASLYSPYWRVRLVEPSAAQRAAALGYVR